METKVDTIIFDLDGVLTDTTILHSESWKYAFDHSLENDSNYKIAFDQTSDYDKYLDGKTRAEGIKCYLNKIGIEPESNIIKLISDLKNSFFISRLNKSRVHAYPDAIELLEHLKLTTKSTLGVASSSKNAKKILECSSLIKYFSIIVDGMDIEANDLQSKPKPDIFMYCFKQLAVSPNQCLIVEDSLAGIKAAKAANPNKTVAIKRKQSIPQDSLYEAGADLIVHSLQAIISLIKPSICV